MELTVNGLHVEATTGGRPVDPDQPLVVFLHGAGFDRTVWSMQTRWFAFHGWSVLAVDFPGHGRSAGPPLASVAEMAEWTLAVVDAAGFSRASLVGHSMGSFVALHAAATAPSRVERLALAGTAASMPVHPDLQRHADAGDRRADGLVVGWSFSAADHLGGHPTPGTWMTGAGLRLMERAHPGVLGIGLTACAAYDEALVRAELVAAPTLLLLGALDVMTPPRAARPLADAFPDATTVVMPEAGHLMSLDQPDDTRRHLAEFLGPGS